MPFPADHFASDATPLLRLNQRPWKIFYRGLIPKPLRNKINAYASRKQMYHTAELWRPFLQAYFQGQLPRFNLQAKQDLRGQKIIWQYWGQGLEPEQLPEMVRLCFRSVEQNLGDYQLIRLDDQTLHNYLDLPDFVQAKRQHPAFKPAFFADLLRLALLDIYGGVWLDASILLTAPLPDKFSKMDYFMFQRSPSAPNKEQWQQLNSAYFCWDETHMVNVMNGVIFSNKNNLVIHHCLQIMLNFWATQDHIPHYFFFQIMYHELIQKYLSTYKCPVYDDTAPHILRGYFNQPFEASTWVAIQEKSTIHSLDRRFSIQNGTLGAYLKNQFLS